jgi:hypothetical protein
VGAVIVPWITARVIVVGSMALAHLVVDRTHPSTPGVVGRVHQGLLGWDAAWYEAIARSGYPSLGHPALRFFPLFPVLGRALAGIPGVDVGTSLLILANGGALVGTALLRVLALRETGDVGTANRTAWLVSLVPPAFVFVMGYAEGILLVCTVGCFLAARRGSGKARWAGPPGPSWGWAAVLGLAGALARPVGVLLTLPVAIEAARRWPRAGRWERWASLGASAAPVAGAGIFCGWVWSTFGNALLPIRVQLEPGHHGGLSDPLRILVDDARGVVHDHFGTALHVPWVVLAAFLIVVCWRRFPASYGAFSTAIVLVAVSGTNLDSFERYALSGFPLVMAGASVVSGPKVERTVLALAAAGLAGYALLAFLNLSVP